MAKTYAVEKILEGANEPQPNEVLGEVVMVKGSSFKQVIRTLDASGVGRPGLKTFGVDEVNKYIEGFLDQGYVLESTHLGGVVKNTDPSTMNIQPTIGYEMVYILVKYPEYDVV